MPPGRVALLSLAALSLLAGAWTGLSRLGLALPAPLPEAIAAHGAIMVSGMLGTLIALERAVALERRWAFAAPLASGLGGVLSIAGAEHSLVIGAFVIASLVFVGTNVLLTLRQPAGFTVILLLGSIAWAAGNLAWAFDVPVERLALLWASFLVLTIAGERLELSRLRAPPKRAVSLFGALVTVHAAGSMLAVWEPELGGRIAGAALVLITVWLLRHDVARHTVTTSGLPRYVAVSILLGYAWLAVAGVLLAWTAPLTPGPRYDAVLHALFLGFVFSMVFGHAPIILPAVLRIELPYAPLLFAPLGLLHVSVALRVSSDLLGLATPRQWAGALNVATLLAFAASVVFVKLRASRRESRAEPVRRALGVLSAIALVFGVASVISGGRTLFDPAVRAAAEPVVPFVLVFNFTAGFAYVATAVGLWLGRRWAAVLTLVLAVSTLGVFAALGIHIALGGAFAVRTVGAMLLRSILWCAVSVLVWRTPSGRVLEPPQADTH